MVTPLLRYLPSHGPARIVVLHRPLAQVLASQAAMKDRLGTQARATNNAMLARQYTVEMAGIDALVADRPHWRVLHVAYEQMLAEPERECRRVAEFLGTNFDALAAATRVDASQRRFT